MPDQDIMQMHLETVGGGKLNRLQDLDPETTIHDADTLIESLVLERRKALSEHTGTSLRHCNHVWSVDGYENK